MVTIEIQIGHGVMGLEEKSHVVGGQLVEWCSRMRQSGQLNGLDKAIVRWVMRTFG